MEAVKPITHAIKQPFQERYRTIDCQTVRRQSVPVFLGRYRKRSHVVFLRCALSAQFIACITKPFCSFFVVGNRVCLIVMQPGHKILFIHQAMQVGVLPTYCSR